MSRDDDQTWADLVDTFHSSPDADDTARRWPAAEDLDPNDEQNDGYGDASVTLGALTGDDAGPRTHASSHETTGPGTDDDHFVPPTPAPIPRGDRVSRLAWAGVISGPVGLILVAAFSLTPPDELVFLAVAAFIAGFVTLIARLRGHHPNDPDNGAVL